MAANEREPSQFERLGGEAVLQPLVVDFVGRLLRDQMIGFLFAGVDRERLARFEYQMTARMLGAPVSYEGRPLPEAHARFRVMDGQFARRRFLLLQTLRDHGVPDDIERSLIAHTNKLRELLIVPGSCVDATGPAAPTAPGLTVTSWQPD